mgnify:CR=1 FL=1
MDPILYWNNVALEANRTDFSNLPATGAPSPEQGGPTLSSRALAIVHLAMYDAHAGVVNSPALPRYLPGLPPPAAGASAAAAVAKLPVVVVVGPEYVTGSTRMKSGTAQKLVLNMISTSVMIHLGRVKGNRMVDMQLSNNKLIDRGTRMVMDGLGVDYDTANALLKKHGSVRNAMDSMR